MSVTWLCATISSPREDRPHPLPLSPAVPLVTDQKIYELCSNETTRALRAVQNRAFIQVPFSASTLGVRIGALAGNLAEAFAALVRGAPLPSLQFTPTSIADDGTSTSAQALGRSGARVYETLPVWNGTDLNKLCPGANVAFQVR